MKKDSWNWVRRMHIGVCLMLVAWVVLTFIIHNLDTVNMHVGSIVCAVAFISQHVFITCARRWYRFDHV